MESCSDFLMNKDEDIPLQPETRSEIDQNAMEQAEVNILINGGYIKMRNYQYVITIDKNEALELGVSNRVYDKMQESLLEGNAMLKKMVEEYKANPRIKSFILEDGTNDSIPSEVGTHTPVLKLYREGGSGIEEMPSGNITPIANEEREVYVYAPRTMRAVDCHVFGHDLTSVHTVKTEAEGILHAKSRVSSGFLVVPIGVSGVNIYIRYQVSGANSGNCSWKGIS